MLQQFPMLLFPQHDHLQSPLTPIKDCYIFPRLFELHPTSSSYHSFTTSDAISQEISTHPITMKQRYRLLAQLLIFLYQLRAVVPPQLHDPPVPRTGGRTVKAECRIGGPNNSPEHCAGPCIAEDSYFYKKDAACTTWHRGATMDVLWARNNHRYGFVRLALVPKHDRMNHRAHEKYAFHFACYDSQQTRCNDEKYFCGTDIYKFGTRVVVPNVPDGEYVLGWTWYGASPASARISPRSNTTSATTGVARTSRSWAGRACTTRPRSACRTPCRKNLSPEPIRAAGAGPWSTAWASACASRAQRPRSPTFPLPMKMERSHTSGRRSSSSPRGTEISSRCGAESDRRRSRSTRGTNIFSRCGAERGRSAGTRC